MGLVLGGLTVLGRIGHCKHEVIEIIEREPERRQRLWDHTDYMKREFSTMGFDTGESESPVLPLVVGEDVPVEVADFYTSLCPAGVYEEGPDGLIVNAPNCVDCKATDVVGPRWTPREGGSGPSYKRM